MSSHRLALEQFEVPKPAGLNVDAPRSGFAAHMPNNDQMQIDAIAEPQQIEPMGDPLIRPAPPPTEDPEQLSLDALRQDLTEACTRLTGVIAAIEADRINATTTAIEAAATRVAEVGIDVIGHIVDEGFATEIAGAVAEIATQIPHNSADLHVAHEDHEVLVTALAGFAPDTTITLISDDNLVSGQAKMHWPQGGVDFDANALSEKVAAMMTERLSDLTTRSR